MGIPSYFLGNNNPKNHKDKSDKHEKRIAKKLKGQVQRGSGAVRHRRGDVKLKELLVECKRTDQVGISIKRQWIEKITMEAVSTGKTPAISLEFGINDKDLKAKNLGGGASATKLTFPIERDWIAVPASFFEELMEAYREKNGED